MHSSETAAVGTQPPGDQSPSAVGLAEAAPRTPSQAAPQAAATAATLCGKPPVMLILCGAPGAGKSTFSARLCAASPIWERVNQVDALPLCPVSLHMVEMYICNRGSLHSLEAFLCRIACQEVGRNKQHRALHGVWLTHEVGATLSLAPHCQWLQDTVKGGKRGTRQQCLALARQILQQGRCAIIDRCNVEPEQRRDFLQLAQELRLPVSPKPCPGLPSLHNLDS